VDTHSAVHIHTLHFDIQIIGEIQFEEFVSVMSRKVQASYTADEVKSAFKVFEGGAPAGYIKVDALEKALRVYAPTASL
jgi:Ca2+-binding EF-hand superfamily protein